MVCKNSKCRVSTHSSLGMYVTQLHGKQIAVLTWCKDCISLFQCALRNTEKNKENISVVNGCAAPGYFGQDPQNTLGVG